MKYIFQVTKDFKVLVKENDETLDEVGAFGDLEGAQYWAEKMTEKFDANPNLIYGQHNQKPDGETL